MEISNLSDSLFVSFNESRNKQFKLYYDDGNNVTTIKLSNNEIEELLSFYKNNKSKINEDFEDDYLTGE